MTGPLLTSRRTRSETARALGALVLLAIFVVGIPIALLTVAPSDLDVKALPSLLIRPDDGTLFLAALAGIAWLAWAAFTLSVLFEAFALARGVPTPRLPGLGLPQRSAAALVGAAAVLLTSNPWSFPANAKPVVATSPAIRATPAPTLNAVSMSKTVASETQSGPVITVNRGDTLWALAERHLGAGTRYRDIAELNYNRKQADGRTLSRDHWIFPGWTLRLPADASTTSETYIVWPGDTLSEIAAKELGDAERYPEIAEATRSLQQPDGAHLTDPDLILPGWTLRFPHEEATSEEQANQGTFGSETSKTKAAAVETVSPSPTPSVSPSPSVSPVRVVPPEVGVGSTPAPVSSPAPNSTRVQAAPEPDPNPQSADDDIAFPSRLVLGLGGIAAAGFIGHLARRRRHQQQIRRPGQRIPMPGPPEAITEQTLRAAQEPFTAADIRRALRALAAGCAEADRDLPRLLYLRVTPESVYLTFGQEEPDPPNGFIATDERTWRIGDVHRRSDVDAMSEPDPDLNAFDPYPALVTLGVTDDDALLVVNLEAAGSFTVVGAPDATRSVLLALVAELSTSTLSENAGLTLAGGLRGLAAVHDLARVQEAEGDQLGVLVDRHRQEVVDVLAKASAVDVHYARGHRLAEDVWAPEIYASDETLADVEPWLATVALACADKSQPGWTLTLTSGGLATLHPAGLLVEPQRLDDNTYAHLLTILATGDSAPVPPVPVPVQTVPSSAIEPTALPSLVQAPRFALTSPPKAADPRLGKRLAPPRVLVLGPVVVEGADDESIPHRRRRATELVTYLALHPGATTYQIDEAIWPGRRVGKQTRNSFVSRARHWLGRTVDGDLYLPHVAEEGDYRLAPTVTCDWLDFQRLAADGLAAGTEGAAELEAALTLVRGRPFLGVDPSNYSWAEADIQEMISAIVDAAHALAELRLEAGDHLGAQRAAAQGLMAEPYSEPLFQVAIEAATTRGDQAEAGRLRQRLRAQQEDVNY